MSLFAIADLHLPGGDDKPMNVFGEQWEGHFERIAQDWRARVTGEDTVLIPGDISWAMQLENAVPDLQAIGALPGRKVLCKGNHEYWWSSISRVRAVLPDGMFALQNDALDIGDAVVCGTRGWVYPSGDAPLSPEEDRVYQREVLRLQLTLDAAMRLYHGEKPLVVMMHYPPLHDPARGSGFTDVLERYPVHSVVYGHLHGASIRASFCGERRGIRYQLTSCDSLGFRLAEVPLSTDAAGAEKVPCAKS